MFFIISKSCTNWLGLITYYMHNWPSWADPSDFKRKQRHKWPIIMYSKQWLFTWNLITIWMVNTVNIMRCVRVNYKRAFTVHILRSHVLGPPESTWMKINSPNWARKIVHAFPNMECMRTICLPPHACRRPNHALSGIPHWERRNTHSFVYAVTELFG